jgi:hypothetical protein
MVTSDSQNTHSDVSLLGVQIVIIFGVTFSSIGSFLLAFQFHRSYQIAIGGDVRKDWSIRIAFLLFISHDVLFSVAGIMFGTLAYGDIPVAQLSSVAFVLYRVYISTYFFWGHWNVYKIMKVSSKSNAQNDAEHIGRRLGLISCTNLVCVLLAILYAFPSISQNHHGWVLILWIANVMAITFCIEVDAVPLFSSREELLKARRSKICSKTPQNKLSKWFSKVSQAQMQTET